MFREPAKRRDKTHRVLIQARLFQLFMHTFCPHAIRPRRVAVEPEAESQPKIDSHI